MTADLDTLLTALATLCPLWAGELRLLAGRRRREAFLIACDH